MAEEPASVDFDRAASFYDATRDIGGEATERTVEALDRELPSGRILEIGVGTGILALPLAARGHAMLGVDLSFAMMQRLVAKAGGHPPFPLLRADATRLPLSDHSVAGAYVRHVFHLIPRWQVAVAELCRVIGSGVVLVEVGEREPTPWEHLWFEMREVAGTDSYHVGLDLWRDGEDALDEAFVSHGAAPRDVTRFTYPDTDTVADYIDEIDRRSPSWTWRVSDERLRAAADVVRRWSLDRYGTLDVRPTDTVTVRWRAYELP